MKRSKDYKAVFSAMNQVAIDSWTGILQAELDGVVAQLVERLVRNEKVAGSIPVGSTISAFRTQRQFCNVIKCS